MIYYKTGLKSTFKGNPLENNVLSRFFQTWRKF